MDNALFVKLKNIPILCVEDEEGIREIIVETLRYYFDNVYEARDGNEAYEIYLEHRPKIILSDIQMQNCDGIEFVKNIRKNDLETNIIMLTAYSNEEYLMDLINLNINHYILKPLNLKKLDEALIKYLHQENRAIALQTDLILYPQVGELLYKNRTKITLREKEAKFLKLLYEKKRGILTYGQIEHELWLDKEMTTYALKSFIKELRAKLPVNIIKNIFQKGYVLDTTIQIEE